MPPARSIFIDKPLILATIARVAREQHKHESTIPTQYGVPGAMSKERRMANAVWVPRDLPMLLGRELTASHRKRAQEAVRELEAAGLIVLGTRHVKLTEAGAAAVEAEAVTDA